MGAEDAAPDVFVYRDAGIVPAQGKKRGSRICLLYTSQKNSPGPHRPGELCRTSDIKDLAVVLYPVSYTHLAFLSAIASTIRVLPTPALAPTSIFFGIAQV